MIDISNSPVQNVAHNGFDRCIVALNNLIIFKFYAQVAKLRISYCDSPTRPGFTFSLIRLRKKKFKHTRWNNLYSFVRHSKSTFESFQKNESLGHGQLVQVGQIE